MDSNALERERGITILAKTTAIDYNGVRINILDTPGSFDFVGEVEEAASVADAAIIVVSGKSGTGKRSQEKYSGGRQISA